ncbi:hypothetical protein Tco_0536533 [Tanacetum coccineum]
MESKPLEAPYEVEDPQAPSPIPASPDCTLVSPYYTPATPYTDDESKPHETSKTRVTSPHSTTPSADYTPPPSPRDHHIPRPQLHLHLHEPFTTAVLHVKPCICSLPLSPSYSAKLTEAITLSPSSFHNRYRGTSELIADTNTKSEESEGESTDSESEEAASEDQQQAIPVEDIAEDEPLGLGYMAARHRALEQARDPVSSTFEVGQSSRSVPDQQTMDETLAQTHTRLPVCTTWEDPKDETIYRDIECDLPPVRLPVQTPPLSVGTTLSPEWFLESPLVSPLIPSPAAAPLGEGDLLEIGAQLELHGSILHTYTKRLDALPPTLFEGYGRDFTKLFSMSKAIHEEIHTQRFRLRILERVQEETSITIGRIYGCPKSSSVVGQAGDL